MQPAAQSAFRPSGASPVSGLHLVADLYRCPPSRWMTCAASLREVCLTYVREAGLLDVGELFHTFEGDAGVTGSVILAESHLCLHTWPEHDYVSLDVFVCNYGGDNSHKARQLTGRLIALFAPAEQRVQELQR